MIELCKTDTDRLVRLLKEAACIIEGACRQTKQQDKARQLRQMAKKIERKKNKNNRNADK